MQKYDWRCPGLYKVPASVAAKIVSSCKDKDGYIQPSAVVEVSKPEEADLHTCFEWENEKAADSWREQQARVLIKNIVIYEVREDIEKETTAFIHVISEPDKMRGYKETIVVVQNSNDRDYVLKRALQELESFKIKYAKLVEFSELINRIDETIFVLKPIKGVVL
jgi:hypothetical protein